MPKTMWVLMSMASYDEDKEQPLGIFTSNEAAAEYAVANRITSWETIPFGIDGEAEGDSSYAIMTSWDNQPKFYLDSKSAL